MPQPTLDDLLAVIDIDGLTPDSVRRLNVLAGDAFALYGTLPYFIAKAIFAGLSSRWDDPQAIPQADYQRVQQVLLPRLRIWMQSAGSFNDPAEAGRVVGEFHTCYPD